MICLSVRLEPNGRHSKEWQSSIRVTNDQVVLIGRLTQVRGWIDRGLVDAQREDFEQHRGVLWVRLDRATVRRLAKLSAT